MLFHNVMLEKRKSEGSAAPRPSTAQTRWSLTSQKAAVKSIFLFNDWSKVEQRTPTVTNKIG